jgi:hypothetical protein
VILKRLKPLVTGRRFGAVTDLAGLGFLVGSGWHWGTTLGLALTGVALLLVGLVVSADEPTQPSS